MLLNGLRLIKILINLKWGGKITIILIALRKYNSQLKFHSKWVDQEFQNSRNILESPHVIKRFEIQSFSGWSQTFKVFD